MKDKPLTKRELNKARRREDIVRVATGMFLEQGYANTTMSGIADAVGGSKATLWSHFSSREDLFAAVVDDLIGKFARDMNAVVTGVPFSLPTFRRACLKLIDCMLRETSTLLYRLVIGEGARHPEIGDLFYARGPATLYAAMRQFFASRFDDAQADALTRMTIQAVIGYRSNALIAPVTPTAADHEAFVDMLIAMIAWPVPSRDDGTADAD